MPERIEDEIADLTARALRPINVESVVRTPQVPVGEQGDLRRSLTEAERGRLERRISHLSHEYYLPNPLDEQPQEPIPVDVEAAIRTPGVSIQEQQQLRRSLSRKIPGQN